MLKNDTHNKKVKKLLTALRNALECGNAIVFMLKSDECNCLLLDEKTTQELVLQQDKWNCLLRTAIKEMEQKLHLIISYKGLSPVIRVRHLPNSFEISDMLKLTGYYSADYLPGCNQEKNVGECHNLHKDIGRLYSQDFHCSRKYSVSGRMAVLG